MTAAQVAERLHARPVGPGSWRCRCPAHRGHSANSLSIRQGDHGRVLIHCFGGCRTADVLAAVGLQWNDVSAADPSQTRYADTLDDRTRCAVASAQESLRRHPGGALLGDSALCVIATDTEQVDHAIARALALAVDGGLVQLALDEEARNAG